MKLVEHCEPVFQYVCQLNRAARKNAGMEPASVRAEIKQRLSDLQAKAQQDPALARGWSEVELPLLYFIDHMIEESNLAFAKEWQSNRLQTEMKGKSGGDEDFFDLLDETLKETNEAATEQLAVYYTCLGLGFTGFYAGQPEYLRRKMMEISARLHHMMDRDTSSRIVPTAYEHVDTSDLIQPPGRSLVGVIIALAAAAVVVIGLNWYFYTSKSAELRSSLQQIEAQAPSGAGG